MHSVTVGKDAQAEVMVQLEHDGRLYRGRGVSTDSVEASRQGVRQRDQQDRRGRRAGSWRRAGSGEQSAEIERQGGGSGKQMTVPSLAERGLG